MAARYVHGCQVFHLHTILLEFVSFFLSFIFLLLMALFSVLFICSFIFLQFSFQVWIVFTIS